jgi:hypothetical protein
MNDAEDGRVDLPQEAREWILDKFWNRPVDLGAIIIRAHKIQQRGDDAPLSRIAWLADAMIASCLPEEIDSDGSKA